MVCLSCYNSKKVILGLNIYMDSVRGFMDSTGLRDRLIQSIERRRLVGYLGYQISVVGDDELVLRYFQLYFGDKIAMEYTFSFDKPSLLIKGYKNDIEKGLMVDSRGALVEFIHSDLKVILWEGSYHIAFGRG